MTNEQQIQIMRGDKKRWAEAKNAHERNEAKKERRAEILKVATILHAAAIQTPNAPGNLMDSVHEAINLIGAVNRHMETEP